MLATINYADDYNGLTPPAGANDPVGHGLPRICQASTWFMNLLANDYMPSSYIHSTGQWTAAGNIDWMTLRYPNSISCPAFPPSWDPFPAGKHLAYAPRWDFGWIAGESWPGGLGNGGMAKLATLSLTVPYLADTVWNGADPVYAYKVTGGYWTPQVVVNNVGVHMIHNRRRTVVAFPDGRALSMGDGDLRSTKPGFMAITYPQF
jgi:hypothetical protein